MIDDVQRVVAKIVGRIRTVLGILKAQVFELL